MLTSPKFSPKNSRVLARPSRLDLKKAIHHAENLCYNYEDTSECHAAWEAVNEMSMLLGSDKNRKSEKKCLSEGDPE
jgi:hypothetical protein